MLRQIPLLVEIMTTPFENWGGPYARSSIYEEKRQAARVRAMKTLWLCSFVTRRG